MNFWFEENLISFAKECFPVQAKSKFGSKNGSWASDIIGFLYKKGIFILFLNKKIRPFEGRTKIKTEKKP